MIFLARHAEAIGNVQQEYMGWRSDRLTEKGNLQAKILARKLKTENIKTIVCSDIERALQTATIIASELEIPEITPFDGLRERLSASLQGRTFREIKELLAPSQSRFLRLRRIEQYDYRIVPDAETPTECYERMTRVFGIINSEYDHNILAISHNGIIGNWLMVTEEAEFHQGDMLGSADMDNTGFIVLDQKLQIIQKELVN